MKTTRTILICLMFVATTAIAQEAATTTAPVERTGYANSEGTRQAFLDVLGKYPPQVSKVLKLDPTLFSNASYLSTYPALAEFVTRHPEHTSELQSPCNL